MHRIGNRFKTQENDGRGAWRVGDDCCGPLNLGPVRSTGAEDGPRRHVDRQIRPSGRRRWLPDTLGVLWVLLAAGVGLTPALAHGWSLGNYAVQTIYGGLASSGAKVHYTQASDQLTLFMPLTNLAWTQVHSGHLPL